MLIPLAGIHFGRRLRRQTQCSSDERPANCWEWHGGHLSEIGFELHEHRIHLRRSFGTPFLSEEAESFPDGVEELGLVRLPQSVISDGHLVEDHLRQGETSLGTRWTRIGCTDARISDLVLGVHDALVRSNRRVERLVVSLLRGIHSASGLHFGHALSESPSEGGPAVGHEDVPSTRKRWTARLRR